MNHAALVMFFILPMSSVIATRPEWQEGVMVQKKGSSYIFIFPPNRISSQNPAGEITIGNSIAVMYALKMIRSNRSRFIGLDGSILSPEQLAKLKPRLRTISASKTFGFMLKDSYQPLMHIFIEPSFMAEQRTTEPLQQQMARQGNLTVYFTATKSGQLRIKQAVLD